jgi:polysaccharide biosynthesis/export protein
MKWLPCTLLSLLLLPAFCPVFAMQTAAKPVLSAAPEPQAVAPPAASTTPGPASSDPSYIIGPDDSLQINVWNEPKLSVSSLVVRPDGMITIPDIGDVPAAGRTPMQLSTDLATLIKKLVIEPNVTVSVLAVNSKRVYLMGEIARVGPLPITPGMSILQAIAAAGGPGQYANSRKIYILRGEPGKQKKLPFDYKKAIKTGDLQGITLMPGDTIVVP